MNRKPVQLHNVVCAVDLPSNEFGEFANAFRYILDGNEVLLDFCIYSARDRRARVASRVRISQELFVVISQRLASGLVPPPGSNMMLFSIAAES